VRRTQARRKHSVRYVTIEIFTAWAPDATPNLNRSQSRQVLGFFDGVEVASVSRSPRLKSIGNVERDFSPARIVCRKDFFLSDKPQDKGDVVNSNVLQGRRKNYVFGR
jgi:hypothetical protein